MSLESAALARVKPSATLAADAKARELKAQGRDVISLAAGEPDFDTPENIKEAAIKAIRDGKTKYTNVDGIPELKEAICAKFERENGLKYKPSQVNVSPGGKPVIYNAMVATLNPGDEVLIPTHYWVSYPDMVLLAGGEPVFVPTSAETGFKLKGADLEAKITPKTRWIILNSPSNPSGAAYTKAELRELADVLLRHPQVWILTDDMYEHLVFDNFEFWTIAQVEPALYDRTLTMNGVSKAYAMTGWRIGYALGNPDFIGAMTKIHQFTMLCAPITAQIAAVEALQQGRPSRDRMVAEYDKRRRLMVEGFRNMGLDCFEPKGAFYIFPSIQNTGLTSLEFAEKLLQAEKVALVPGDAFGACGEGYVRCSYAASSKNLTEALDRIARFVGPLLK